MGRRFGERAISKFRQDGFRSLLRSTARYAVRYPVNGYYLLNEDEDIFSYASEVHCVEAGTESIIEYDGSFDPPHPSQIPFVEGRAVSDPRYVCAFRDATLRGSRPLVHVDGKFILPSSIGNSGINDNKERYTFRRSQRVHELLSSAVSPTRFEPDIDTAFLLAGHFTVFGHWTFEVLPKLRALEEYTKRTGIEPEIVTKGQLNSWQRESLALLGYPPESIVEKPERAVGVRTLLVPSHRYLTWTHVPSFPSSRDLHWVRERINGSCSSPAEAFGERIYICREDAPRRRVVNRKEVYSILEEYDFEIYEPGRLSFDDQVRLFAGADLIVGPYGAGMSNIVFADNANIVELVVDAEQNIHHFVLANLLDLDYEYVYCRSQNNGEVATRDSDIMVDTERLRAVLETLI